MTDARSSLYRPAGSLADGVWSVVLTPESDDGAEQSSILADIATNFHDRDLRERALRVETYTQFRALVRYAEESFSDVGLNGGIPTTVARE